MLFVFLIQYTKVVYSGMKDRIFYRNMTNNPKFKDPQSQVNCKFPNDLCDKYQNMAVNCSRKKNGSKSSHMVCNSLELGFRLGLKYFTINCEEWENNTIPNNDRYTDKYSLVEESCFVDVWIDRDIVYTNNFSHSWFYAILMFLGFVLVLGVCTLLAWIFPDFSIVRYAKRPQRKLKAE